MEDEIDLLFGQEDKIGNVVPDEAIIFVPCQMADVRHIPGDQIVDRDDAMPFGQQAIGQMRSEKSGATGYDGNGFGREQAWWSVLLIQAAVADEQFRQFVIGTRASGLCAQRVFNPLAK